jgi:hypothetical protein
MNVLLGVSSRLLLRKVRDCVRMLRGLEAGRDYAVRSIFAVLRAKSTQITLSFFHFLKFFSFSLSFCLFSKLFL